MRKAKKAAPAAPAPIGRPTEYSDDLADRILERIIEGATLRDIDADETLPAKSTVLRWVAKYEEFEKLYALAQQAKVEGYADELPEIADDGSNDWMLDNKPENPGYRENGEAIRRSALRISTRQWLIERLKPKKYMPALKLEHAGSVALTHEAALDQLR